MKKQTRITSSGRFTPIAMSADEFRFTFVAQFKNKI
jgi:hypothetical protein